MNRSGTEAQKRRGDAEQSFRLLVSSVKDYAIFMLDPEGIIATWNAGAERLKGYRANEIIGQHFSVFYTPDDRAAGKPARGLQRALDEGRTEDEGWRVRKDGTLFWADVVITAVYDETGELRGFAKVTRDLTARRRAEEERMKLAHAEEAIRVREEFMSIAAHELRTPLNALQLQMAGLKLSLDPARNPNFDKGQLASRVERLFHLTDRLANLVTRLLDISRLASGRFTLERQPMDLVACTREVIAGLEERARSKRVRIDFHGPDEAIGSWDRLRIEQVVYNLLENALEYGEGAPIDVSISRERDFIVIDVADRGPGIPEEERARVFERFASGERPSHRQGLGLGLYISRAIIEVHGGEIRLMPTASGAHFRVRLPATSNAGHGAEE